MKAWLFLHYGTLSHMFHRQDDSSPLSSGAKYKGTHRTWRVAPLGLQYCPISQEEGTLLLFFHACNFFFILMLQCFFFKHLRWWAAACHLCFHIMAWDCEWWLVSSPPWMLKYLDLELWKVVSSLLCQTLRSSVEHCRLGCWWCWTWVIQNGGYRQYKEESGPEADDGYNWGTMRRMGITGEEHWGWWV